ncbi:MAG: glucose-1-phosphate cytidylyltransferase [Alphaproteobacteria bacterium 41-28]|nr:MAG: glucose-1-phosphate cytidylyltransferase [Alphaproteobacteria bacterium 41-28]
MKVVILAGGYGTRLAEETDRIPKPMVTIGSKPILWHIMKSYAKHGLNDFVICAGYKAGAIIEYFTNYQLHNSDLTVDLEKNEITFLKPPSENWKVSVIDTALNVETGGRLLRVRNYITPGEPFCMTYGDGVCDVNIKNVIEFHKSKKFEATLTAVRPPSRFGTLEIKDGQVSSFSEKPVSGESYINGGFFVLEHSVFDLIEGDHVSWEYGPLETLAQCGKLGAYIHDGFWHPMDTLRDRRYLEQLWDTDRAPWK